MRRMGKKLKTGLMSSEIDFMSSVNVMAVALFRNDSICFLTYTRRRVSETERACEKRVNEKGSVCKREIVEEERKRMCMRQRERSLRKRARDNETVRWLYTKWIPHNLTEAQKLRRIDWYREMMERFADGDSNAVYDIVTGKWFAEAKKAVTAHEKAIEVSPKCEGAKCFLAVVLSNSALY
ncbi:hypothetical protein EVAR_5105_1 [Eumeta japonica]|uniref:Uncharacterized protein n=1 Tax=Eumeta variegata TaxID=151549 RepID=A0A4C1SV32_EUMVA|nr:hypothetical protein EVAR_5105_1 [Eumeta japonica]